MQKHHKLTYHVLAPSSKNGISMSKSVTCVSLDIIGRVLRGADMYQIPTKLLDMILQFTILVFESYDKIK